MIKRPQFLILSVMLYCSGMSAGAHRTAGSLSFLPTASNRAYVCHTSGYSLELLNASLTMRFQDGRSLVMNLHHSQPQGLDPVVIDGRPTFRRVIYRSVVAGIDLLVYGNGREIEYDWLVAPGVDPSAIQYSFRGAQSVQLDSNGDLVIQAGGSEVRHGAPFLYQDLDGVRRQVDGSFVMARDGSVGFRVGAYDRQRPLIVDPQIVYRTALSGPPIRFNQGTIHNVADSGVAGIAVDRAGNTYITGTDITGPGLVNPIQSSCPSGHCIYVTKLSSDGRTVIYSTYLGAPSAYWYFYGSTSVPALLPSAIACDPDGNVYVTGTTAAANLPQVGGGTAQSAGGDDAFIVKLDPNGGLKGTLLIGGKADDAGTAIALGQDGYLYVAGTTQSSDFPISRNPMAPPIAKLPGMFVLKIDPKALNGDNTAGALRYSLAGQGQPEGIAADAQGNAYVAVSQFGVTDTSVVSAVIKINPDGSQASSLSISTGAWRTLLSALALDASGFVYVAGTTNPKDIPPGSLLSASQGRPFLAKLDPNGSGPVYLTYLTNETELVYGLAVDGANNAYISGLTVSPQFPILNSIQYGLNASFCYEYYYGAPIQGYCDGAAGFVLAVKPDGTGVVWSSLLPGVGGVIALDSGGGIYLAGSSEFLEGYLPSTAVTVMKISQPDSPIPIDGIVNGASFHPGLSAPGGLATVYVHGLSLPSDVIAGGFPLPLTLGGVSITVGGKPAPILAVTNVGKPGTPGSQQINFQVPFEAPPNSVVAEVDLTYQGVTSSAVPVRVGPGIFTLADGSGAVQHAADFAAVTSTNPARKGEVVIAYLTGLGAVSPAVPSGTAPSGPAALLYSPAANLGTILYAGLTPGYPGLYQINLRISPDTPSGSNQLKITWSPGWGTAGLYGSPDLAPTNDTTSNSVTIWVQ